MKTCVHYIVLFSLKWWGNAWKTRSIIPSQWKLINSFDTKFLMRLNEIWQSWQLGATAANNYWCQYFCYISTWITFLVLWVVELIHRCGRKKEHFMWSISQIFPPHFPPLLSIVHQCVGSLSSRRRGGSWLSCQVLPAISAVSILEIAPNSGGSRMCQAPNLPLATQLLMLH